MPRCEGPSNLRCPSNKNDSSVKFSQGDLWLCAQCHEIRFPRESGDCNNADNGDSDQTSLKLRPQHGNPSGNAPKTQIIVQPLLTYIVFALQSGTAEKVKNAALGYFSNQDIQNAKDSLWDNSDTSIIGDKQRRKDSSVRTEKEANTQDIINAIVKLEERAQMPCFVIDAYSLHVIPRSHPEELCDISLADRLNRLEQRINSLQEAMDSVICENISLREGTDKNIHPSYSAVVNQRPQLAKPPTVSHSVENTSGNQHDMNAVRQHSAAQISIQNENWSGRGSRAFRGRRGLTHSSGLPRQLTERSRSFASLDHANSVQGLSASQLSLNVGSEGGTSSSFMLPRHSRRKQQRQTKRQVVTGRGQPNTRLRGAPEPVRDLFIFRVDNDTSVEDIKHYIENIGYSVKGLDCVSNVNAKFKSFKLTVPVSEFKELFDEKIWPPGVRVRRFIPPRSGEQIQY